MARGLLLTMCLLLPGCEAAADVTEPARSPAHDGVASLSTAEEQIRLATQGSREDREARARATVTPAVPAQ